jgi:hypothetical protein
VDIQPDRYLVGLIYATGAVTPAAAAMRPLAQRLVVAGTRRSPSRQHSR